MLLTWSPAELVDRIYNTWSADYLYDKNIKPTSEFTTTKDQLEKILKKDIILHDCTIHFDDTGNNIIINKGNFLLKEQNNYYLFDYYIYQKETKAIKSYETDHKAGLEIYKNPKIISEETINKYKTFMEATLTAEKKFKLEKEDKKENLIITFSRFADENIIQLGYKGFITPSRNIFFDNNGNITNNYRLTTPPIKSSDNR
jgi:hypothetical protein